MTMWFFDDAGEVLEYQIFRRKDQPLENVHLGLRLALQKTEAALKDNPEDPELQARAAGLQQQLKDLEEKNPWLTFEYPLEYLLWGPPHG